ncbi:hypothetical protein KUTeg_023647 [Tegillarca granosa]|uniref:Rhodanese domain-containing protein n=1 Tax=Tegillarca granosa TaxID=220873 RepID=A0ABQ9E2S9_TEGGR|nr:hypothetical protein KUTeg_023647 [Tegillarca granosa]
MSYRPLLQYVSAPLCCPSRSSILTGKYVHNHGAVNNSVNGNCSSLNWQTNQEIKAFPVYLQSQGYTTFFAGKYLNQYGFPKVGGVRHVPPGWKWWMGLVGNSVYYDYILSVNGSYELHGHRYPQDYLTDVINKRASEFLNLQSVDSGPFFMMLSTPACHFPFTAAPQYKQNYTSAVAPRNGSFNVHAKDKHWLLRQTVTPMPNKTLSFIDNTFKHRWQTLLSVDDMVENVINLLQEKGLINNTYIIFSSDNGYHLGQFSLPNDKRQLYEFDVRVPLMIRGPGIKPGTYSEDIVMNIDLAPTFVNMSGLPVPPQMDGTTILPILHGVSNTSSRSILVEHQGEHTKFVLGCPQYKNQRMAN